MKVLLLLDRDGRDLAPLAAEQGVALLTVANKPMVVYVIEQLARLGLRDVVIVAGSHARQVASALGDGARWGLRFRYFPGRGAEHPAAIVSRLGSGLGAPLLVVRGDVVLSGIGHFMDAASSMTDDVVTAGVGGRCVGLAQCREPAALAAVRWPFAPNPAAAAGPASIEPAGLRYAAVASLDEYHAVNLDVAAGAYTDLRPPGWERRPGLLVGPGSFATSPSIRGERCVIGRDCRIHEGAELRGRVVVGDNCFIDRGAHLEDSVVLAGTYIGENLDVRNALVAANRLLRADSGASYTVPDPFVLASMHTGGLRRRLRSLGNRLAGLLLLLLSAPLWPLAALLALPVGRGRRLRRTAYRSNQTPLRAGDGPEVTFSGWEWGASPPVLRWLPMVLAVPAGHIDVIGACPRQAAMTEDDHWDLLAGAVPAGLFGPVQLELPPGAPPEERALNEIQFANDRSLRHDLRYLAKAGRVFFSRRAWCAKEVR